MLVYILAMSLLLSEIENSCVSSQDFQFFPPELAQLQERELAVHKVAFFISVCLT